MPVHGSLAYQKQREYRLTIFCEEPGKPGENPCRNSSVADWDKLIETFGPDFIIPAARNTFLSKLICSKCGSKHIGIILSPPEASRVGNAKS